MAGRILPFEPRPEDPDRLDFSPYLLRVVLKKGSGVRLYEIRKASSTTVQTWTRWNKHPHRAELCDSIPDVERVHGEYLREIRALKADGWIES